VILTKKVLASMGLVEVKDGKTLLATFQGPDGSENADLFIEAKTAMEAIGARAIPITTPAELNEAALHMSPEVAAKARAIAAEMGNHHEKCTTLVSWTDPGGGRPHPKNSQVWSCHPDCPVLARKEKITP